MVVTVLTFLCEQRLMRVYIEVIGVVSGQKVCGIQCLLLHVSLDYIIWEISPSSDSDNHKEISSFFMFNFGKKIECCMVET